jgi:hypothetical protein
MQYFGFLFIQTLLLAILVGLYDAFGSSFTAGAVAMQIVWVVNALCAYWKYQE